MGSMAPTLWANWTQKKPDISHLREFGCDVWVLDESKNRSKLDPKSKKMKFVGFIRQYDITMPQQDQSKCPEM
jgi:hypothetical protein